MKIHEIVDFCATIDRAELTKDKVLALCEENGIAPDAKELEPVFMMLNKPKMLKRIGAIPLTAPQWLVKNFLELSSFSSLYGDSDSGKSFFAIALAFAVATGTDFYGHAVLRQGSVLYLAQEGQNGLARRFNACSIRNGVSIKDAPLFTNALNLQLLDDASVLSLIEAISEQVEQLGSVPSLLVLDTWSRVLGGDDSSTTDSARGVAVVDALRKKFEGMTVLVVHHSGHDKTRARGWSGLRAAVDTEYRQSRGEDGIIRVENSKNKEAARIDGLAFEFADVELGIFDEDGEQVTSAILNQIEYAPEGKGKTEPKGKNQKIALEVLKDLLTESGKKEVLISEWKWRCKLKGIISKNGFYAVRDNLEQSSKISLSGLFVSIPDCETRGSQSQIPNIPKWEIWDVWEVVLTKSVRFGQFRTMMCGINPKSRNIPNRDIREIRELILTAILYHLPKRVQISMTRSQYGETDA
ncbi:MAG: hypothetical protein Ta2A_10130 [Treponemataceae bacterium]|nr:MAG: hypothetical protein Ta2A_10130 [Treponemataceae bacterium]